MNKVHDTFSSILGGTGIIFSLQEVNETLNLILLICSIANILLVAVSKILILYQSKKLNAKNMAEILTKVADDLEEITGEPNENN